MVSELNQQLARLIDATVKIKSDPFERLGIVKSIDWKTHYLTIQYGNTKVDHVFHTEIIIISLPGQAE